MSPIYYVSSIHQGSYCGRPTFGTKVANMNNSRTDQDLHMSQWYYISDPCLLYSPNHCNCEHTQYIHFGPCIVNRDTYHIIAGSRVIPAIALIGKVVLSCKSYASVVAETLRNSSLQRNEDRRPRIEPSGIDRLMYISPTVEFHMPMDVTFAHPSLHHSSLKYYYLFDWVRI